MISGTIGDYVDQRGLLAAIEPLVAHVPGEPTEVIWLDYVADVGDGYDATRAIASVIADDLTLDGLTLEHGRTLIFGGDQVYPTPSVDDYERRFVDPYSNVFENGQRTAYAIPGNHDWYDGLTAFSSLFCSNDQIGQVAVPQTRSYWVARPHPTWTVWGLDTALNRTIDPTQLAFFQVAGERFASESGSKGLIVCVADPFWEKDLTERFHGQLRDLIPESAEALVFLSGDRHYFAAWRHEQPAADDRSVREVAVTAGGGGAYLSLTHKVKDDCPALVRSSAMRRITVWPSERRSRAIAASVVGRIWMTPSFAAMVGLIYALLGSLSRIAVDERVTFRTLRCNADPGLLQDEPAPAGLGDVIGCVGGDGLRTSVGRLADASVHDTPWWIAAALLLVALRVFARKGGGRWFLTLPAALLHAFAHLGSALLVAGAAMWVPAGLLEVPDVLRAPTYLAVLGVCGAAAGTSVFAIYLVLVGLVGVNTNELSTAAMHQGWKNFLRISLSGTEARIHAIGLQKPDSAPQLISTISVTLPDEPSPPSQDPS